MAANDSWIDHADTWVDRHAPQSEKDLIVHKKKVAEVQGWLEAAAAAQGPACAVITGADVPLTNHCFGSCQKFC